MTKVNRKPIPPHVRTFVAASQKWKCKSCACLLDHCFQIDHTKPLCAGGTDKVSNLTALCANCHSRKTFQEYELYSRVIKQRNKRPAGEVKFGALCEMMYCVDGKPKWFKGVVVNNTAARFTVHFEDGDVHTFPLSTSKDAHIFKLIN